MKHPRILTLTGILLGLATLSSPPAASATGTAATPAAAAAAAAANAEAQIAEIAARWTGQFDNHRQVDLNVGRQGAAGPELTRERRDMRVARIAAPAIGDVVLFYEEYRSATPGLAHRQRVVSLVQDEERGVVRAEQWFFRAGPSYDRKPLAPEAVARMTRADFQHQANCDLFFTFDEKLDRYRGSMQPRTCQYPQGEDGIVFAEFDMLLYPGELWYRDRSIRVANGSIRGEIDGFSWLLFDRRNADAAAPSMTRYQGVWRGTFRRYDAAGKLTAEFPSEIIARVVERDGKQVYHQTNTYRPTGAPSQTLESFGEIRDGRIWFSNDRLDGWSMDIAADTSGRGNVIVMDYKDGSGLYVYEIVTTSVDGRSRARAAQYLKDGRIVRRTLIDEELVTRDWRAFEADPARASR